MAKVLFNEKKCKESIFDENQRMGVWLTEGAVFRIVTDSSARMKQGSH